MKSYKGYKKYYIYHGNMLTLTNSSQYIIAKSLNDAIEIFTSSVNYNTVDTHSIITIGNAKLSDDDKIEIDNMVISNNQFVHRVPIFLLNNLPSSELYNK